MQGEGTVKFGESSTPNNSSINRQVFLYNMVNSIETQEDTNHILPSEDVLLPFPNVANHGSASFTPWICSNTGNRGDTTRPVILDETKRSYSQSTPISNNATSFCSDGEKSDNMVLSQKVDMCGENPLGGFKQGHDSSHNIGLSIDLTGSNSHASEGGRRNLYKGSSSTYNVNVLSGVGSTSTPHTCTHWNDDVRPLESLEDRLTGKRKMFEGSTLKSSTGGGSMQLSQQDKKNKQVVSAGNSQTISLNISTPAINPEITLEGTSQMPDAMRMATSGCSFSANVADCAENTHRSTRRRLNPSHEHGLSPFSTPSSGYSMAHQPLFLSPSHIHLPEPETRTPFPVSQAQTIAPLVPQVPWNPNGFQRLRTSNSRVGNASTHSSREPFLRRHIVARSRPVPDMRYLTQDTRSGDLPTQNMVMTPNASLDLQIDSSAPPLTFASPGGNIGTSSSRTGISSAHSSRDASLRRRILRRSNGLSLPGTRNLVEEPRNWNPSTGNVGSFGNIASDLQVGLASASQPFAPPTWPSHQGLFQQHSSNYAGRPFQSAVSEYGGPSNNMHVQSPNPTPQESVPSIGAGLRALHQSLRSANTDRQTDSVIGIPLLLRMSAAREERSRVISEIRNALDYIRRGENLRIEDLLFLDRSLIRSFDLHDRHRDMRLDVDNMSYEELLALEERIGDVNTGLTSETVTKHLKQKKFSLNTQASESDEPCCVCQEEFVENDDLGLLNCGHGFHSKCIKQWLSYKNLCPICKTTGLNT